MRSTSTAPLAAASLIGGYAVVAISGSRTLGGLVLLAGALACMRIWQQLHGSRTAVTLGLLIAGALVASHLLALLTGAWPAVLLTAAATAAVVWSAVVQSARI